MSERYRGRAGAAAADSLRHTLTDLVKDYGRLAVADGLRIGAHLPADKKAAHELLIRTCVANNCQMLYDLISNADLESL